MMKNITSRKMEQTMYSCFRNSLAPSDILPPISTTRAMLSPPLLLMELLSGTVEMRLSANQFHAAQSMPSPPKTNTIVSAPLKERGASPSGVDEPSIYIREINIYDTDLLIEYASN